MVKSKQQKQPVIGVKKTGAKVSAKSISNKYKTLFRDTKNQYEKVDAYFQSLKWRTRVIDRPQNAKERSLRDKYIKENDIESRSAYLLNRFAEVGLKKAEAIQAVKTDKVETLTNKWTPRLTEFKKVQDALRRGRMGELLKDEQKF